MNRDKTNRADMNATNGNKCGDSDRRDARRGADAPVTTATETRADELAPAEDVDALQWKGGAGEHVEITSSGAPKMTSKSVPQSRNARHYRLLWLLLAACVVTAAAAAAAAMLCSAIRASSQSPSLRVDSVHRVGVNMHDGTDAVQFSGARVTVGHTADERGWCDVRARFTERLSALTTRVFAACLPAAANADVTAASLHAQRTRAKVATMKTGVFARGGSLLTRLTSMGHFANGQAVRFTPDKGTRATWGV
jgi:hypothetical protein